MHRPAARLAIRSSAIVAIAAAAVLAAVGSAAGAGDGSARVVNGTPVSPATYAARWTSIVALVRSSADDARDGQFCAGTLISPTVVATAAHCVTDEPYSIVVVVDPSGEQATTYNDVVPISGDSVDVIAGRRRLSDTGGQRIGVRWATVHPQYDFLRGTYDVALLKLGAAPRSSMDIDPTPPVSAADGDLWGGGAGEPVNTARGPRIAGWGERDIEDDFWFFSGDDHVPVNRPTGTPSKGETAGTSTARAAGSDRSAANTLEQGLVPIISDHACENGGAGHGNGYGRDFDARTQLCAGRLDTSDLNDENALNNGLDTCYGDSGGPLLVGPANNQKLAGITSWGFGCATRTTYGVYTRVAAMRGFLTQQPVRPLRLERRATVTGTARVGRTLSCTAGDWSGGRPIDHTYLWVQQVTLQVGGDDDDEESEDEDEIFFFLGSKGFIPTGVAESTRARVVPLSFAWRRIPGAGTRPRYVVRSSDAGTRVGCIDVASNEVGTQASAAAPKVIPGKPRVVAGAWTAIDALYEAFGYF